MHGKDHVHTHGEDEECKSCESLSVCLTDEEEDSEMDDDYDPNTGLSGLKKEPSSKLLKA